MHQAGSAKRKSVPFIFITFITLLVLWGGSRTQAAILTCAEFAAAHCGGAEVMVDTRVTGGSASVVACEINIAASIPLKFKNPGNPAPCLTVGGSLRIFGAASNSLRIEHTTIDAGSILMGGPRVIHVEDSTLSVTNDLSIESIEAGATVLVEDSVLEVDEVFIGSSGEVTLKGADIRAVDGISIGADGTVKVKEGSKLRAGFIEISTPPGTVIAVTGSELTADFTAIGFDGGAGDAVDNIKANTFIGGGLTIACPARVTSNTFNVGSLSITGSSPCTCSKNTPNVVCPTS
jgi:hypothetical protein